jgi:methionyl-tRNA formyltransferase
MLKIIFFSSSSFCLPILEHMLASKDVYEVLGVVTQPNWENHGKTYYNPVAKFVLDLKSKGLDIPLFQPNRINKELEAFYEFAGDFDMAVVASFGQIIGKSILDYPKYGCINWHPSLLPKYRGATPMQSAILNGDAKTGLSWIEMGVGMDSGKILLQEDVTLENKGFGMLSIEMGVLGAKIVDRAVVEQKLGNGQAQDEKEVVLCKMLSKEDGLIDPKILDSDYVHRHVLAYEQFPKTRVKTVVYGEIKILSASPYQGEVLKSDSEDRDFYYYKGKAYLKTKKGLLEVHQIQLENGRKVSFK